jgi:hypothetical protein
LKLEPGRNYQSAYTLTFQNGVLSVIAIIMQPQTVHQSSTANRIRACTITGLFILQFNTLCTLYIKPASCFFKVRTRDRAVTKPERSPLSHHAPFTMTYRPRRALIGGPIYRCVRPSCLTITTPDMTYRQPRVLIGGPSYSCVRPSCLTNYPGYDVPTAPCVDWWTESQLCPSELSN